MANGVNKAIVLGRLGQDPDIRYTTNGGAVANMSVATTYKNRDNEYTEWHRLIAFGKLAEIVQQYVKKGDMIYTEGRIQTRKWQDQQGNDRYSTEIVINEMQMLGSKNRDQGSGQGARRPAQQPAEPTPPPMDDNFDDIPF